MNELKLHIDHENQVNDYPMITELQELGFKPCEDTELDKFFELAEILQPQAI